jgi:hypothetical protein
MVNGESGIGKRERGERSRGEERKRVPAGVILAANHF